MVASSTLRSLGLAALSLAVQVHAAPPAKPGKDSWKDEIKHIIWIVMENRSFDNLMGGMNYTDDIDGLLKEENLVCLPVNVTDPNNDECFVPTSHNHNSVLLDPEHGSADSAFEAYSTFDLDLEAIQEGKQKPDNRGFLTMQLWGHDLDDPAEATDAINYYPPEYVPILTDLAKNFVLFDRWFGGILGPTNPNRAMLTSGTSAGHGENDYPLTHWGSKQRSIFQILSEKNITWGNYGDTGGVADANFYAWTRESGTELTNVHLKDKYFTHLEEGTLPELVYLNPTCCGVGTESMHPDGLVSDGEQYIKDMYEALRASKYWEKSLMVITFDEHGGFWDHVPPVVAPRPDNLTWSTTARDGTEFTLDFGTTNVRLPTLLISPWVPKGHVEHKGKNNGKEYSATSILKFLGGFWDFPDLSPRVSWSSTWEHLMLKKARKDTPKTLPPVKEFDISSLSAKQLQQRAARGLL
ncbi:hypothetical protein FQN52_001925 [Onygenales sp. PD_12]|nr:hypothetical protein FQN52_001925 [Onygenales sp. PD_12]